MTTILNFLSVYIIWGSTYLAIKYAVVSFPPLLMAATRFFLAGAIMMSVGKLRKERSLLSTDKKLASVSGILLVLGNGFVCIAELSIPSGLTAIVIGMTPIFIMLLNWFFFEKVKPNITQTLGVLISFVGIIFLMKGDTAAANSSQLTGIGLLGIAVLSWSIGTLMQRKAGKLTNIFTFSGFQLLVGSGFLLLLGLLMGEVQQFDPAKVNFEGIIAVVYLIFFGSAVAFSSYIWLSRNIDPSKVATYAVVNPVVAVWLGWMIAGEPVNFGTMVYSLLVLIGLFLVIFAKPSDKKMAPVKNQSQAVK